MNIETKWLKDFIVLSETLNFSRASKLRFVTQPAFSRRIKALESNINCELFNRGTHPVALTEKGLAFKAIASKMLTELEEGISRLNENNHCSLPIKFATTHTLSTGIFPLIAQHLSGFEPNVSTELKIADSDDCIDMLANNTCDFLLSFSDPELEVKKKDSLFIGKVRLLPVCIPNKEGEPLHNLTQSSHSIPYLAYQANIYLGRVVNNLIANNLMKVNVVKRLESSMADNLKMMAIKGVGIAWIPEYSIQEALKDKSLVICGDKEWQPELEVRIYKANKLSVLQQKLWDYLASKITPQQH
ncbi:LysR family transcriptional regulator [Colwellia sp. RSH04]|uniref:LysR family transcriptional regulator n=1 Tax=Colwellia sp. RSH04 TaxID=2305464 RepID=UPI000E577800|nr:LysR family transcriptional regulator [Colwellia sp. RSH04]RHW76120.1 LysR family transcriptional regulator [Colwellia sp. RSH04]